MTEPDAAVTVVPGKTADFTIRRDPHVFTIDDDVFKAPSLLSSIGLTRVVDLLLELGDMGAIGSDVSKIKPAVGAIGRAIKILMPGPSGRRFVDRLNSDPEQVDEETGEPLVPPIDLMRQALPALLFLLECYGLRPTGPSSSSSGGLMDGNTQSDDASSAVGALPQTSESMNSTQLVSST
jgi:hypothetical protein